MLENDRQMVEVASFLDVGTAESARIALQHEGIDCELLDVTQAGMPSLMIPIRLVVPEDGVDDAVQVLTDEGYL